MSGFMSWCDLFLISEKNHQKKSRLRRCWIYPVIFTELMRLLWWRNWRIIRILQIRLRAPTVCIVADAVSAIAVWNRICTCLWHRWDRDICRQTVIEIYWLMIAECHTQDLIFFQLSVHLLWHFQWLLHPSQSHWTISLAFSFAMFAR